MRARRGFEQMYTETVKLVSLNEDRHMNTSMKVDTPVEENCIVKDINRPWDGEKRGNQTPYRSTSVSIPTTSFRVNLRFRSLATFAEKRDVHLSSEATGFSTVRKDSERLVAR